LLRREHPIGAKDFAAECGHMATAMLAVTKGVYLHVRTRLPRPTTHVIVVPPSCGLGAHLRAQQSYRVSQLDVRWGLARQLDQPMVSI